MNIKRYILCATILFAGLGSSCDRTPVIDVQPTQNDPYKENMINANKYIATAEDTQIESYIARREWKMEKLSNGSWVGELQPGSGRKLSFEDTVTVQYKLEALNGAVIYEAQQEDFVVGHHKPTVGLDRAVMELKKGSKARVILPSSLGYGVTGDGDLVPSRTVLIYTLEIQKVAYFTREKNKAAANQNIKNKK